MFTSNRGLQRLMAAWREAIDLQEINEGTRFNDLYREALVRNVSGDLFDQELRRITVTVGELPPPEQVYLVVDSRPMNRNSPVGSFAASSRINFAKPKPIKVENKFVEENKKFLKSKPKELNPWADYPILTGSNGAGTVTMVNSQAQWTINPF